MLLRISCFNIFAEDLRSNSVCCHRLLYKEEKRKVYNLIFIALYVIIFFYMIIRCREKSFVFIIGMIMITAQIIAAILSEVVSTTSL